MIRVEDHGWDGRARMAERLDVAARAGGMGIWEWRLPASALSWDERMFELHGMAPVEAVDLADFLRAVDPGHRARVAAELESATAGLSAFDTDFLVVGEDGRRRWIRSRAELIHGGGGRPSRLLGASWDITDDHRLADALHEGREQLEITLASIGDAVITTDAEGRVTFANAAAATLTGLHRRDWDGRALESILEDAGAMVAACLAGEAQVRRAIRLPGPGGQASDLEASAACTRTRQGEVVGAVLVLRDVTEAVRREEALRHAAAHDGLTGLANRAALETALAGLQARGGDHVLCYLDIDRFKIINDSAGHGAGDLFLRQIAGVFLRIVKPGDLVARIGGDEFAILLADETLETAETLCGELVRAAADFRFAWEGRIYPSGVSIGLTPVAPGAPSSELLGQADAACYAAKSWGRGRVSVYRPDDRAVAQWYEDINLVAGLREMLAEGRLALHAQEIVPASGGARTRHYELLLRMRARDGTMIAPGAFIPAAERFDLMGELDRWVLAEALERLGPRIRGLPSLRLSINLSGNTLNDPKAMEWMAALLARSHVPAEVLTFEVTETAALNSLVTAGDMMAGLRASGYRIALDDFGTGLSSFSYLKHFPIDSVKIDGSFIRNIAGNAVDRAIVESMNALAHRLGARTVAEFVHDEATAAVVRAIGIDYLQGYVFGEPEPFVDVLARMEAEAQNSLCNEGPIKNCD